MSELNKCVIIGASHAGVTLAFALRREGWRGEIIIIDRDPATPYHRPPLSKSFLTSDAGIDDHLLMSSDSYKKEGIQLMLGAEVTHLNNLDNLITLRDGQVIHYDKLVLATGASPFVPPIEGIKDSGRTFYVRDASDALAIRETCGTYQHGRVVIIGGGYIGLECAASMSKLGAAVTVLERDSRLLSRVTAPEMSDFFLKLHSDKGVKIELNKNVSSILAGEGHEVVSCDDGTRYEADIIIVGVGVTVNTQLAELAALKVENGICIDETTRTSDDDIYAIGDCTQHYNPHYDRRIRLESVQNAVDQAKVAAKNICGVESTYDAIPWFWSDQYDIKLQMVGLSNGYTEVVLRNEVGDNDDFSIWYFKNDELLAVDAVNNAKAYVLGSKFIKSRKRINKSILSNADIPLKPADLIITESKST